MGWLPDIITRRPFSDAPKKRAARLGILAIETAKTMSRLLSLYKSLTDDEITRLKHTIVKSEGVSYLTSDDDEFLLSLASTERFEDLDRAAAVVTRLGKKCNDSWLNRFDLFYTDLKLGIIDSGKLEYGSRYAERKVLKMEKLVSSTACLHAALEILTEMEVTERTRKKRGFDSPDLNSDLFYQKLDNQRKEVCYFKARSLWQKTFDKSVGQMATIVIIVYSRICSVFKPYISVLPSISLLNIAYLKPNKIRIHSRELDLFFDDCDSFEKATKSNRVFQVAGPSTVGGSGLALHYASVILQVEKYLDSGASIGHEERESLYQMLPENLKALVRAKLSKKMKGGESDEMLAEGWRAAIVEIMGWLGPVADDTVTWQVERNVEKMKFDSKPSVLLLQTLHFADKVKTEAAIAEVLVGLSCIYTFENRKLYVS